LVVAAMDIPLRARRPMAVNATKMIILFFIIRVLLKYFQMG
jgi:hypothetical protein